MNLKSKRGLIKLTNMMRRLVLRVLAKAMVNMVMNFMKLKF